MRDSLSQWKKLKFETRMLQHTENNKKLSLQKKAQIVKNNTAAQHKHRKSLSPDTNAQIWNKNAEAHRKQHQALSPDKTT
jgi:hypothetical protein